MLGQLGECAWRRRYNYLMLFLGFIRFAHLDRVTPGAAGSKMTSSKLLDEQRVVAEWVAAYPQEVDAEIASRK